MVGELGRRPRDLGEIGGDARLPRELGEDYFDRHIARATRRLPRAIHLGDPTAANGLHELIAADCPVQQDSDMPPPRVA